nr:hypothetical protein [Tanacetum cinerariifolium]
MAEPLSPDHVFDFSKDDPTHDLEYPEEEPKEEPKEESEEEPKVEPEEGPEEVIKVSLITPPPLAESLSDYGFIAPIIANKTVWMPPLGSTFEVGGPSSVSSPLPHLLSHETKIAATRAGVNRIRGRMNAFDVDLACIEQDATRTSDGVLALQEENRSLKRRVYQLEVSNTLAAMDRDKIKKEFFSLRVWLSETIGWVP